ncbi:peptidoglycan-binding protein [Sediminibacillus massiliensis]|uniref:peptidoglycan-binding protein n=1 Tax=Sediminibacillus massiliensis TaxID=1926277 RepID=UPI00098830C6|nr:peptidoglycan-binding protein [Sediminibacillus massiliensis]
MALSVQTLIDRSVRNMGSGIHPVVKEAAIEVIKRAYDEGIYAQISSGYRSNARQQQLYNQGRTTPGNIVTNARPGTSYHNYGLAVDYFLVSSDGSKALWTVNNKWKRVAAIGKSLGFEWGGDWTSFKDYPHLQMTGGLSISQLQRGARPNLSSKAKVGQVKSATAKGFYENGDSGPEVEAFQKRLLDLGYKLPKYGADGNFGDETEDAVRQFQEDREIEVDGFVGPETQAELKKDNKIKVPETNLKRGDSGTEVEDMQAAFASIYFYPEKGAKNNGIDGRYGPKTENCVYRFQKYYGLKKDGKYGPETRGKLKQLV